MGTLRSKLVYGFDVEEPLAVLYPKEWRLIRYLLDRY